MSQQCDGKCAYTESVCAAAGECQREKAYAAIQMLWVLVRDKRAALDLISPLADLKDMAIDHGRDATFRRTSP